MTKNNPTNMDSNSGHVEDTNNNYWSKTRYMVLNMYYFLQYYKFLKFCDDGVAQSQAQIGFEKDHSVTGPATGLMIGWEV